jgi:hypothetical protein
MTNVKAITTKTGNLQDVSAVNRGSTAIAYENNRSVFHPNVTLTQVGWVRLQRDNSTEPVMVELTIYCENMLTETSTFGPFLARDSRYLNENRRPETRIEKPAGEFENTAG